MFNPPIGCTQTQRSFHLLITYRSFCIGMQIYPTNSESLLTKIKNLSLTHDKPATPKKTQRRPSLDYPLCHATGLQRYDTIQT